MRKILTIALACIFAALASPSKAAQTFEGLWATSKKDCPEHDGPDSKTLIDFDNVLNGKPAPLIDRYENHCRVDRQTPAGDGLVLETTCFEFWDDYAKGENGEKVTIKLVFGPKGTIRIDGKPYLLCKRKSELPKNR